MDCTGDVEPVRSMGGKYSSRGDMLPDAQAGGEPLGTTRGPGGLPGACTVAARGMGGGVTGDRSAGGM